MDFIDFYKSEGQKRIVIKKNQGREFLDQNLNSSLKIKYKMYLNLNFFAFYLQ